MLDIEYRILQKIWASDSHRCTWTDVLNAFDPQTCCNRTHAALCCLLDSKLVRSSDPSNKECSPVALTNDGCHAMLAEEERLQEELKRERKRKRERAVGHIISAGIALVSAVIGALLPSVLRLLLNTPPTIP